MYSKAIHHNLSRHGIEGSKSQSGMRGNREQSAYVVQGTSKGVALTYVYPWVFVVFNLGIPMTGVRWAGRGTSPLSR